MSTIAVLSVGPGEKIVLINNNLLPRVTLADPELTLSLPRGLTAGTGMDALSHCLEAYFSSNENPPAKAVALDGITRIVANIRTAYNEPRCVCPCHAIVAGLLRPVAVRRDRLAAR